MRIGFYSPNPELLRQEFAIMEEFNRTACLDLTLHCYDSHQALTRDITKNALDILVYDMDDHPQAQSRVQRITQIVPNCRVILLSSTQKYALFGYTVHAAGYLLAPLDADQFLSVLIDLIRQKMQLTQPYLPVKIHGVWSQIDLDHIAFLESCAHSLIFHLDDGRQIKVTSSFKEYENLLSLKSNFVRCHKSYIINLDHVKTWEMDNFTLENDRTVKISRPYWQTVRKTYACYLVQTEDR